MIRNNLIKLAGKIKEKCSNNYYISTAESCTGGLLAAYITVIPGSSHYFKGGYVTYTNEAKINMLAVKSETLEKHSAISKEIAQEMAHGCLKHTQSDLAISVTGLAGPSGATEINDIGTVWLGVATKYQLNAHKFLFPGGRKAIRTAACREALNLILENLT